MSLLASLQALAAQQQVAAGMAAAAVAGTVAYSLKAVPGHAWKALQDLCSVTLVVEGRDELYRHLNVWLSRDASAAKSQRLKVQSDYDYEAGAWGWKITLGAGWHLLWVGGWPLFVNRSVKEGGDVAQLLGAGLTERLFLVSPGRRQTTIRRVVADAERIYNNDGLVQINIWHGGHYMLADRRRPRALETVFLPADQKARLVRDLTAFNGAREEYRRRGTPWRRGYLFDGKPGTGKTSLIFALAGLLDRSIYLINLASVTSDNDLVAAFNEVGNDGVVVIEDIDAAEISRDREQVKVERAEAAVLAPGAQVQKLTLSGLLNAIDGLAAREGRLLFATTNHPENLDPALLRAGRFDVRETIGPLGRREAQEMFRAFRGTLIGFDDVVGALLPLLPLPAATLQNLLQADPAHAVREPTPPPSAPAPEACLAR